MPEPRRLTACRPAMPAGATPAPGDRPAERVNAVSPSKWSFPRMPWKFFAMVSGVFPLCRVTLAWALAAALLPLGLARAAGPSVTDDRGQTVTLAAPAQRIVTLLPSLAETVCELGACARIVGVDRYTRWPAALQGVPRVGGGLDPDIEAIVALKPDLVLAATSARAATRLQALGVPVVALEPRSLADTRRTLLTVARLLGLPEADGLRAWLRLETVMGQAAQSIPPRARGARVYFEVSSAPHAAGEASFIGELLAKLGARSVVPASMGAFPRVATEFVLQADPDVVMVGDELFTGLGHRPGWNGLRALREQRVCVFRPEQADILVRAGPRLGEAARLIAGCLAARSPVKPTVAPGAGPALPPERP